MCVITVCGMAFLWHQVRCMTSILMLIGQHLEEPQVKNYVLELILDFLFWRLTVE